MSGYFVVNDMITKGVLPKEPALAMLRAAVNTTDYHSAAASRSELPVEIFTELWHRSSRPLDQHSDLCSQQLTTEALQWALANVDEVHLARLLVANNALTATQLNGLITRLRSQPEIDPEIEREVRWLTYTATRVCNDPEATKDAAFDVGGPALILWLDRFDDTLDDASLEAVVEAGHWRPEGQSPSEARSLNAAMVALGERRHAIGTHPAIRQLRQAAGIVPQRFAEQLNSPNPATPTYDHVQRASDPELLDQVLHSQVPVEPGGADVLAAHLVDLFGTDQTTWEMFMALSCEFEGSLADTIAVVESLHAPPPAHVV
jgi:hypothetical protein